MCILSLSTVLRVFWYIDTFLRVIQSIALDVIQQPLASLPLIDTHCDHIIHRFHFNSLDFVFFSHFDCFIYNLFVSLLLSRVTCVTLSRTLTVAFSHWSHCDSFNIEFDISILVFFFTFRLLALYFLYSHAVSIVYIASHMSRLSRTLTNVSSFDCITFCAILTFLAWY